ncbi:MAG: NADH-quinone oxidoreductase subunit C [Ignavibacteria bacterium]
MTEEKLNLLKSKLQNYNVEYTDTNGTPALYINKDDIIEICKVLKNDNDLKFNLLVDAISVDRFVKKNRFEMFYNLVSIEYNQRIFLKIKLESHDPEMQSLSQIWKSANWYEREAFDMMGIKFTNHPDLRRMYMPENYEYNPLKKDFPLMGIPDSIPLPNK